MPTTLPPADRCTPITARIAALTTIALADMTRFVFASERPDTEYLLPMMMDELEARLSQAEIVAFTRSLAAVDGRIAA